MSIVLSQSILWKRLLDTSCPTSVGKKNGSVKQILEVIVRAVQLHEEQLRKLLRVDTCSHEPTAMSSVVS